MGAASNVVAHVEETMLGHGLYFEDLAPVAGMLAGTAAGIWSLVRSARSRRGALTMAWTAFGLSLFAMAVSAHGRGGWAAALADYWWTCLLPTGIGLLALAAALIEAGAAGRDEQ